MQSIGTGGKLSPLQAWLPELATNVIEGKSTEAAVQKAKDNIGKDNDGLKKFLV